MRRLCVGLSAHRMVYMNDDAIETAQKSQYFIELTTMDYELFYR